MKPKHFMNKVVLILLILSLQTPEYAVNVLAATDTNKAVTAAKRDGEQTELVQPSPTPGNLNSSQKAVEQPAPTLNMITAPDVDELTTATESTYLTSQMKNSSLSTTPFTDSCEVTPSKQQTNIDRIKEKYHTPGSQEMNYTLFTEEQVKELIVAGAWIEDIYELAYLSYAAQLDAFDLLRQKLESKLSWDEFGNEMLRNGQKSGVSDEVYKQGIVNLGSGKVIADKTLVTDSVYEDQKLMPSEALTASTVSALDAVVNAVIDGYIMQTINQTNKPQYSDRSSSSELVDPISGALTWKENQISLPGREGLDLNLGVIYNSTQARDILVTPECGKRYNFLYTTSELGIGWSFRFPSIQNRNTSKFMYYDGEGGFYEMTLSDSTDPIKNYTHFEASNGKERRILYDADHQFTNGQYTSEYYVEYADKRREYQRYRIKLAVALDLLKNQEQ